MCDLQAAVSLAESMVVLMVLQLSFHLKSLSVKNVLLRAQVHGLAVLICTTHEVSLNLNH